MLQKIHHGKWEELDEIDKEWTTIESRHGYPSKRRYVYISGGHDTNTLVVERLWDSFAALEEAFKKVRSDPEAKALQKKGAEIVESEQMEFLWKLERES
jgi:hypothetical protein